MGTTYEFIKNNKDIKTFVIDKDDHKLILKLQQENFTFQTNGFCKGHPLQWIYYTEGEEPLKYLDSCCRVFATRPNK
jgi:hypothetical protein